MYQPNWYYHDFIHNHLDLYWITEMSVSHKEGLLSARLSRVLSMVVETTTSQKMPFCIVTQECKQYCSLYHIKPLNDVHYLNNDRSFAKQNFFHSKWSVTPDNKQDCFVNGSHCVNPSGNDYINFTLSKRLSPSAVMKHDREMKPMLIGFGQSAVHNRFCLRLR